MLTFIKNPKCFIIATMLCVSSLLLTGCGLSEETLQVLNAIDDIGNVTLESGHAIENAEEMFNNLTEDEQADVENHTLLVEARSSYDILEARQLIHSLGRIGADSGEAIIAAEAAYDSLTETQRLSVDNYITLQDARIKYDAIESFVAVGEETRDGDYIQLSSDRLSIFVDTNPRNRDGYSNFETMTDIQTIHNRLELPDSLYQNMLTTRALDGRQSRTFNNLLISWSYHPNQGLSVVYELILN
jgi:hypothetical protein